MPGCFEFLVIARVNPSTFDHTRPPVLDAFFPVSTVHRTAASADRTAFELPATVADFAFPEGVKISVKPADPSFHAFVLTDVGGTRYFGYSCRKSYQLPRDQLAVFKQVCGAQIFMSMAYSEMEELPSEFFAEQSLIIITALPLHRHWEHLLITFCNSLPADTLFDQSVMDSLETLLMSSQESGTVIVDDLVFDLTPPPSPWMEVSLRPLMRMLEPSNVIKVFNLLLNEQSIILVANDLSLLTGVAEALLALMSPLEWPFAYIPLLPVSLVDVYDAPMPFIVGVPRRALAIQAPPDHVAVVDLDNNLVSMGSEKEAGIVPLPPRFQSRLYEAILKYANLYAYHHPDQAPRKPFSGDHVSSPGHPADGHSPPVSVTALHRAGSAPRNRSNVMTLKTINALYSSSSGSENEDIDSHFTSSFADDASPVTFRPSPKHRIKSAPFASAPMSPSGRVLHPLRVDSQDSTVSAPPAPMDALQETGASSQSLISTPTRVSFAADQSSILPLDIPLREASVSAPPTSQSPFPSSGLDVSLDQSSDEESHPAEEDIEENPQLNSLARISDLLRRSLPRNPLVNEPKIFSEMLYKVFMSIFVSLLRSYRPFLLLEIESRDLFDKTSFLAEMKEDMVEFMRKFVGSQMFSSFIQERITSCTRKDEGDTFDRLVREKNLRRMQRLALLANTSKKDRLMKQCYVVKMWKRRVLQLMNNDLTEYDIGNDNKLEALNRLKLDVGRTRVVIPQRTSKMPPGFPFEVICGDESFLLSADDSKTRRQWIRIIKAKTSRDLALQPIAAAPAVMDAVQKMKKEHRRTVAMFQSQIILPSTIRASTSS